MAQTLKIVLEWLENIAGKGENAGYKQKCWLQAFSPFPTMLS